MLSFFVLWPLVFALQFSLQTKKGGAMSPKPHMAKKGKREKMGQCSRFLDPSPNLFFPFSRISAYFVRGEVAMDNCGLFFRNSRPIFLRPLDDE